MRAMAIMDVLEKLDRTDQEKINYFFKLLLNQSKYKKLKDELAERREEIKKGDVLDHEEIWNEIDV